MIVLVHNILPPYRVSLFNAIHEKLAGRFTVLLVRETHRKRRKWSIPWDEVSFNAVRLRSWGTEIGRTAIDLTFGVRAKLDELGADVVVVAGWNLMASWVALRWCRQHQVPAVAWVESWSSSGSFRGGASQWIRRRFLRSCSAAIVPGAAAKAYVEDLAPGLECFTMPNSVEAESLRSLPAPTAGGCALFVGELSARKGFDLILECTSDLLRQFGRLLVAGTGPMSPGIHEVPGLEYTGFIEGEQYVEAMRQASVVLLPSRRDPWPLVAVEALIARRPLVVGPGVGSAADLARVLPSGVFPMREATGKALIDAANEAQVATVDQAARGMFTPGDSATRFIEAVRLVSTPSPDSVWPENDEIADP